MIEEAEDQSASQSQPCGEEGPSASLPQALSAGGAPAPLVSEFTKCLGTMSHSRAGWDYELPRAQRVEEDRQERVALTRARAIWAENPELHADLRAAFIAASPLATMREIEDARS